MTAAARFSSVQAVAPAAGPGPGSDIGAEVARDYLEGAGEIAAFLGPKWNERKVYHAREISALPIRRKQGIGLYAFKSELLAALKDPETLGGLTPDNR